MNTKIKKSRRGIVAFGIMLILLGLVLGFGLLFAKKIWNKNISGLYIPILIATGCLVIIGLLLIFLKPIISHKIKSHKKMKEEVERESDALLEEYTLETQNVEEPVEVPTNIEEKVVETQSSLTRTSVEDLQALTAVNYNSTHTLQRAKLNLDGDDIAPQTNYGFQRTSAATAFVEEEITPAEQKQVFVHQETIVKDEKVSIPTAVPPVDLLHRDQPKATIKPKFILPPLKLLDLHENSEDANANNQSCQDRLALINTIFDDLHIGAKAVGFTVGPSVTRYDIQTNSDVSVNVINKYIDDLSVRLYGVPVRFQPVVLGKATSGLEMPNEVRTNVGLRESIEALPQGEQFLRNIPFGKDISGKLVHANLQEFPHMLVSGTSGSGKSIFVQGLITTLIMRNTPDELRLLLIDPKRVEMSYFKDIPHLLCPPICEPQKSLVAFKKLVDEMERRYNLFEKNYVRDITSFNKVAKEKGIQPLPIIVVFVDEYADLNDSCKEIRAPVVRIAQKARGAGIHLCIATQRPSVNVIDGVIKANIATHVALMAANATDSNTIIGEGGAEKLLPHGDMLIECPLLSRTGKPRVQGCFVDTPEINRVCDYLRSNYGPNYDPEFLDLEEHVEEFDSSFDEPKVVDKSASEDELYNMIKEDVTSLEFCSISYIQRTYAVGFPKAGRLFNKLLKDGYVSREHDARGSKVLIHGEQGQSQQLGSIEQSSFVPNETSQSVIETNEEPSIDTEVPQNDEI